MKDANLLYITSSCSPTSLVMGFQGDHNWVYEFTGLDYWTGLLDWTTGLIGFTPFREQIEVNHMVLAS